MGKYLVVWDGTNNMLWAMYTSAWQVTVEIRESCSWREAIKEGTKRKERDRVISGVRWER
jgi:hypothetical protein